MHFGHFLDAFWVPGRPWSPFLQSRKLVNQEVWFTSVLGQPRVWFTSGVGEPRVCLTGCLGEPRFGSRGKSGRSEAVPMSILACILQWKCASTFSHGSGPGKARVWFTSRLGEPRVWFTSGLGEPRVWFTSCVGEPRLA